MSNTQTLDSVSPGTPPTDGAPSAAGVAQTAGQRLRQAREAKGLTREDIAQAIKYTPRQIDALEADNAAALPPPAMVRGMIRSYVKHLGQKPEDFIAPAHPTDSPRSAAVTVPTIAIPFSAKSKTSHRLAWALFGLVLLAVAAFFIEQHLDARGRIADAIAATTSGAATTPGGSTAVATQVPVTPTSSAIEPAAANDAPPGIKPAPLTGEMRPTVAGQKRIELQFQRDSWVEVRGAEGQILHNRLNLAGSTVNIEERPPFKLIIGAASGVRLRFEGQPIDLVPFSQVDVARVALE